MLATMGEDYSTMETIRLTGGLLPDGTWEDNWENLQIIAQLARQLNIRLVTFHAGFLPHDERDPEFAKLQHRLRLVAEVFAAGGIDLGFETGQESASTLLEFLEKLKRPNVGVNFDPANMILYDKGSPIEALRILGPWLKQVHIKDARRTRTPGAWGDEVPVGAGEVDWPEFFRALDSLGFTGYCCIEREAGSQRLEDIRTARRFIEETIA
jgi:sugar phosphate isomerase/epimerase